MTTTTAIERTSYHRPQASLGVLLPGQRRIVLSGAPPRKVVRRNDEWQALHNPVTCFKRLLSYPRLLHFRTYTFLQHSFATSGDEYLSVCKLSQLQEQSYAQPNSPSFHDFRPSPQIKYFPPSVNQRSLTLKRSIWAWKLSNRQTMISKEAAVRDFRTQGRCQT